MITFVGTQSDFYDALNSLLELEFEALEIYEAAINRLENQDYKHKLQEFKKDHKNHVETISNYLKENGKDAVNKPGGKQLLAIAGISFSSIMGDQNVLKSLLGAEEDTNKAYERITSHEQKSQEFSDKLWSFYDDEKRHKAWIERTTKDE